MVLIKNLYAHINNFETVEIKNMLIFQKENWECLKYKIDEKLNHDYETSYWNSVQLLVCITLVFMIIFSYCLKLNTENFSIIK